MESLFWNFTMFMPQNHVVFKTLPIKLTAKFVPIATAHRGVVCLLRPDAELTIVTKMAKAALLLGCFRTLIKEGSAELGNNYICTKYSVISVIWGYRLWMYGR